jgi:hypothetical protein
MTSQASAGGGGGGSCGGCGAKVFTSVFQILEFPVKRFLYKGGLISESYSLWLKSPKKGAKSLS